MKKLIVVIVPLFISMLCRAQGEINDPTPVEPPPPPTDIGAPLVLVEEMPSFPGGMEAMNKFIQTRMKFPYAEYEKGLSGTCYVSFIVEEDGSITNVKILRGIPDAPALSAESIRLIKSISKFIPGRQNGVPSRVLFNYPVKFNNPVEYSAEKIKTAKEHNAAAEKYLTGHDYKQALKEFDEVLMIFPNDRDALSGKGNTLYLLNRTEEASELMLKIESGVPFTNKAVKKRK